MYSNKVFCLVSVCSGFVIISKLAIILVPDVMGELEGCGWDGA